MMRRASFLDAYLSKTRKTVICDKNTYMTANCQLPANAHFEDRRARMIIMIARSKDTTKYFRTSHHDHTGASVFIVRVGGKSCMCLIANDRFSCLRKVDL